ncbi:NAD(P)/FAD-dependent oxidoreductase [Streptomyces sp. BH106]|uniref:NAD(P)/FAD-dependent oxidoreductase n=1 Tax=Streptomyces sp. BH106 TaxID=3410409 RepID=UPI003CF889EE
MTGSIHEWRRGRLGVEVPVGDAGGVPGSPGPPGPGPVPPLRQGHAGRTAAATPEDDRPLQPRWCPLRGVGHRDARAAGARLGHRLVLPAQARAPRGVLRRSARQPGGRLHPDAGYVNDPRLAAANLAAAAAHRGARFAFRQRVTSLTRAGTVWRATIDGRDPVEAPVVVNAAGPRSSAVKRMVGATDDFTIGVAPMRQEVHHVPAPSQLLAPDAEFFVISDMDLGTYMRPETGGNLLVGGTEPECDPLEWIEDPDAANPHPTVARFEAQVTRAARRFPDLTVPNRPQGVAGVYDVADDWTPIYDKTALPGFYVAIGTSGNQFKNAPIIGSLMDRIIDSVENGHDHDADPVHYTCPHAGHDVDLGTFSRKREANTESSGTVLG